MGRVFRTACVVSVMMLGACASDAEPLAAYQGRTVADVVVDTKAEVELRVVDTSVTFGDDLTYSSPAGIDDAFWTVLTLCADAPTVKAAGIVELSVVPNEVAATAIVEDARTGGYEDLLICSGLTYGAGTGEIPKGTPS